MSWTVFTDIQNRWTASQTFTASETLVTTLIGDVEDTIKSRIPDVQTRIDSGDLPIARVVKVVSRVVIRHLLNPTGQRNISETRGPNQMSVTFGGNEPGALVLTEEDWRELQPEGQGKRTAFTIDTTPTGATVFGQDDSDIWDRIA